MPEFQSFRPVHGHELNAITTFFSRCSACQCRMFEEVFHAPETLGQFDQFHEVFALGCSFIRIISPQHVQIPCCLEQAGKALPKAFPFPTSDLSENLDESLQRHGTSRGQPGPCGRRA